MILMNPTAMLFKTRTALMSLIVALLYTTLSGCCGCRNQDSYCVNINGTTFLALNNSDSTSRISKDETVPGLALVLELTISNDIKMCYSKPNNYFGKTAYALTCPGDKYTHSDSITHVSITADRDFDAAHPEGAELNDLFYRDTELAQTNHNEQSNTFLYYAQKAPEQNGTYVFTATLTFGNGNVVESKTQRVNLSR